jgi:2-oxo-4-hydroxy-4-carboxy--5-ureidoimidazoline (OHCU) decarboxylase
MNIITDHYNNRIGFHFIITVRVPIEKNIEDTPVSVTSCA